MDDDYIALRARERGDDGEPGDSVELGVTDEQARDLADGKPISYFMEDGEPTISEDGVLGERHVTQAEQARRRPDGIAP